MEAYPLFRQHCTVSGSSTAADPGAGRPQFSGTGTPSDHARVPLRLRRRSVRRSAGDSTELAGDGWSVRITERLRDMEPMAVGPSDVGRLYSNESRRLK